MATEKQRLTFISYSRDNKDFALELAKELRAAGFLIWLDQLDIPTGARWDDAIERALEQCEIFMVVLTPNSIASNNVKDEIGFAIDANKRIMPILLEHANIPFRLRRFQYVDFTNISYNEGIDSAKHLLRKLLDEPAEPGRESTPANIQAPQPRVDRSAEMRADTNHLARQRAEAVQKAREREGMERSSQVVHPIPAIERKPSQPQTQRQSAPKLIPMVLGISLILLLCLGGGVLAWPYIFHPTPTDTLAIPTTETTSPSEIPPMEATTEAPPESLPTTPAPPSITIPSDPVEFINFYFKNINDRNYDLTWSLLSEQFKAKFNLTGKESYINTWNQVSSVTIHSADHTKISDTVAIVIISSNIQSKPLNYYLVRDNPQSTWLFYPMPESYDVSCSKAPKRLSVGINALVVTANDPLFLRDAPTDGGVIEEMSPGTQVSVIGGPECNYYRAQSVFFWWWKVQSSSGNQGWIVEGTDARDAVFIQPAQ